MRRKGEQRRRNVGDQSKSPSHPSLVELPPLVLTKICDYVDDASLAVLLRTSKCLSQRIDWRSVWNARAKRQPFVWKDENDAKTQIYSSKDRYALGKRLKSTHDFSRKTAVRFHKRLLPWLCLEADSLWYSRENAIELYALKRPMKKYQRPSFQLTTNDDVGRFAMNEHYVVAGTGAGSIALWDRRQQKANSLPCCIRSGVHKSDVRMCDMQDNLVVSGSRDATIQLWRIEDQSMESLTSVPSVDRVWSVRLSADSRYVAVGTAGICETEKDKRAPLFVWDVERERQLCVFGNNCRKGAGVTDISFESSNTVMATSYDATVQLYDMRTNKSEWKWDEPFDSALFCLASDSNFNIVVGTSRHCAVWAIDRRYPRAFKGIYLDTVSSPIYSVARTPTYVFGASDTAVHQITL